MIWPLCSSKRGDLPTGSQLALWGALTGGLVRGRMPSHQCREFDYVAAIGTHGESSVRAIHILVMRWTYGRWSTCERLLIPKK